MYTNVAGYDYVTYVIYGTRNIHEAQIVLG